MSGESVAKDIQISVGDKMEDGTIYAGISPDTHKPMYATPNDAPGTFTFNQAARYANNLDAHGHHDFNVPSQRELNVLFNNCTVRDMQQQHNTGIRGLIASMLESGCWYWSASQSVILGVTVQDFNSGRKGYIPKNGFAHLRCVR